MLILYIILACQILALVTTNLFFLDKLLGYDCSATYLQVMEIWNQKTFFIQNWHYTTTLTWDTPLLFAVPLYGLLKNVFLAYGIANLISLALLCLTSYQILKLFHPSKKTVLLFYICLFTPYITYEDSFNRIDYFAVILSILGVYTLKIAIIQLLWLVPFYLDSMSIHELYTLNSKNLSKSNKKLLALAGITLFLAFFTALSSGYHVLLFGIVPPLLYLCLRNIFRDQWERQSILAIAFLGFSIFSSILGKMTSLAVIGYTSHDSILGWTPITYFWNNFMSIFEGYLVLTGALPHWESPQAFSKEGIVYAFLLALSMGIFFTGISTMITKLKTETNSVAHYFASIFMIMFTIFVFVYTKYGSHFFEIRYLIPNFMILILFASLWLGTNLDGNNKSLRFCLYLSVFPALIVANINSYYYLNLSQNNSALKQEILAYIEPLPSPLVYVIGEESMILGKNLRVFSSEKIYLWAKTTDYFQFWGDRGYYAETAEHQGETLLLATPNDFAKAPYYIQSQYEEVHQFQHATLSLYHSNKNPIDFSFGITHHDHNIDYLYTTGIHIAEHGEIDDDGYYFVIGDANPVAWSEPSPAPTGLYDITVHYQFFHNPQGEKIGNFTLTTKDGSTIIAEQGISSQETSCTLESVNLSQIYKQLFQYHVTVAPDVVFLIKYFEIQRVG